MDIQAYIQSGIIETYVLGLASAEETVEVETLRLQYAEIGQAIDEFAVSVEKEAFANAVAPPAELKAKILSSINKERTEPLKALSSNARYDYTTIVPASMMRNWRMAAAASIILLITSAALNIYLYRKYDEKEDAYQALLSDRKTLEANNQIYQTELKEWQSAAHMMADPAMTMIKMRSTKGKDDAATVFWNSQSKDVYVMANNLPEPVTGKQYQLWAMVDGKPVDAGVLNSSCSSVCKMKNIPRAEAFAITLEKEGGSQTPNLKAMLVMGNI